MHISEWQDIFRSGNVYFRVAMHISERQCIFQRGKINFRAAVHISERQYIFQRHSFISAPYLEIVAF